MIRRSPSVSGAFYLKSDGTLRAYTGSWVDVQSGVPTGQYLGFTIHADYAADKWNLYYTSGAYLTNMTLTTTLEFAALAAEIQTFSFESGDTAFFDGVAASPAFLTIASGPANVQAIELSGNNIQNFELPVYPAALTNSGNDFVSAQGGDIIRTGMFDDDKLIFLTHNNGSATHDGYILAAGIWDEDPGVAGTEDVGVKELLLASRLQLDLTLSSGVTRWAFIAYDTALSLNGEATGAAAGHIETIVINGTDVNSGFTALEWLEGENTANSLGFGAANPVGSMDRGDFLYVQRANGPSWKTYWWDETANAWQDGANTASAPVPAGARCWVERKSSVGGRTFTITH